MYIYYFHVLPTFVNQFAETKRELAMAAMINDQQPQPGTAMSWWEDIDSGMSRWEDIDSGEDEISEEEFQQRLLEFEELLATADLQVEDIASPEKMGSHGGREEVVEVDEDEEIFGGLEPLDLGPRYNAWILEDCNCKLSSLK